MRAHPGRIMLTIRPLTTAQFGDEMSAKGLAGRLLIGRQIGAVATAFMIPVSTSGQAIALSIFVLFAILTVEREEWLGQRFLGSNHIRQPRRVCKTKCG